MNKAPYSLAPTETSSPARGEDMGHAFKHAAELLINDYQARAIYQGDNLLHVAQLYRLGAEAYVDARKNSIGHSRRARYDDAANELQANAEALEAGAYISSLPKERRSKL